MKRFLSSLAAILLLTSASQAQTGQVVRHTVLPGGQMVLLATVTGGGPQCLKITADGGAPAVMLAGKAYDASAAAGATPPADRSYGMQTGTLCFLKPAGMKKLEIWGCAFENPAVVRVAPNRSLLKG